MQAEEKETNYFQHFFENTPEETKKHVLQHVKQTGLKDDINSYQNYATSYNEFIKFWINPDYLKILEQIAEEGYIKKTARFKLDTIRKLLEKYNDGDPMLHATVNGFKPTSLGFSWIASREDATPDEKKASEMHRKYFIAGAYPIDIMNKVKKNIDPSKPMSLENLDMKGWIKE